MRSSGRRPEHINKNQNLHVETSFLQAAVLQFCLQTSILKRIVWFGYSTINRSQAGAQAMLMDTSANHEPTTTEHQHYASKNDFVNNSGKIM
eukprot:2896405-Amphidinium_carterae.1